MGNKKLRKELHELLMVLNDNITVYKKAADNATSVEFKGLLMDHMVQRYKDINDVKAAIKALGGRTSNFIPGIWYKIRWLWMDIKATISNNAELTMIEATQLNTVSLINEYESILGRNDLPANFREQLERQRASIDMGLTESELSSGVYS